MRYKSGFSFDIFGYSSSAQPLQNKVEMLLLLKRKIAPD
jgi:hypothetical protein